MAHHTLGNHYQAYLVAFIFAAAIFGLRKNFLRNPSLKSIKGSVKKIVAFNLMFFFITSPLCPVMNIAFPDRTRIGIGPHELQLDEVLRMIPPNASILTQNNIFTQVSDRVDAYAVPDPFITAGSGTKTLALTFVNETIENVEYVLVDNKTDSMATQLVISFLQSKPQLNFILIATRDNDTIRLYWNSDPKEP
jgi:uncharacterized membrane protein